MNLLRRAALPVLVVAGGIAVAGHAPVHAQDAAPEVAWWTSNQIAGVPIGQALLVPPGGSQVASRADGPVSIAAVRFAAGAGGAAYAVDLELGSDIQDVIVIACPVTGSWEPVQGAPLSDAPAWDCTRAQAVGAIDAGRITWDLPADFVRGGAVDAMLLPPEAAGSTSVTMSPPDEDSVTPLAEPDRREPSASDAVPSAPTSAPARPSSPGPAPATSATPSFAPSPIGGRVTSPTAPVGLPSPLPTTPPADPGETELAVAVPEDRSSTSGRVLGGLVLAALLAGTALASRSASGTAAPGSDGRGIGRFVQARTDPPRAI